MAYVNEEWKTKDDMLQAIMVFGPKLRAAIVLTANKLIEENNWSLKHQATYALLQTVLLMLAAGIIIDDKLDLLEHKKRFMKEAEAQIDTILRTAKELSKKPS